MNALIPPAVGVEHAALLKRQHGNDGCRGPFRAEGPLAAVAFERAGAENLG